MGTLKGVMPSRFDRPAEGVVGRSAPGSPSCDPAVVQHVVNLCLRSFELCRKSKEEYPVSASPVGKWKFL